MLSRLDFDRINSNSPPNRQARVNPFLKDLPKAKTQEQPSEPQAKKLQETFTHPLELNESKENAQSDEDELEPLPKHNNNNNNNVDLVKEKDLICSGQAEPQSQPELATTDNQNGNKSSDSSEEMLEGDGIVREELPAGKVMRRKKSNPQQPPISNNNNNNNTSTTQAPRINHRASVAKMEGLAAYLDSSIMSSSTEVEGKCLSLKIKSFVGF